MTRRVTGQGNTEGSGTCWVADIGRQNDKEQSRIPLSTAGAAACPGWFFCLAGFFFFFCQLDTS